MPDDIRSIRKVSPSYVIAAGTQVVLKVSKVVAVVQEEGSQGEAYRKTGTVGIVIQCPPNNDEPYIVQFADGTTAKAYFHELTLRRKEVEMELDRLEVDLLPFVIYRCQVGSIAFGLAGEDADDDLRGIYLPPASLHWGLRRLQEQLELGKASATDADSSTDQVYWELEKFLLLALKANPNVLETLWTRWSILRRRWPMSCAACGRRSSRSTFTKHTRATSSVSSGGWPPPTRRRGPSKPSMPCT